MRSSSSNIARALMLITGILIILALLPRVSYSNGKPGSYFQFDGTDSVTYTTFTPNNIHTWVISSGIYDQNPTLSNWAGFQWPKNSSKYAIFTTGLTIMAYVDGNLRMASASYNGEYFPGKVIYVNGVPTGYHDTSFKIYKVSKGEGCTSHYWANWGDMVPYGAPYIDVNNNEQYEPCIDTPGVKNAEQTIFMHITDAFPNRHTPSEGFGGGTDPLFAELGITIWGYQGFAVSDAHFTKFNIINKNTSSWDSAFFSIISDPDVGDATDDYIGTDTNLNLSYAYNSDNNDGNGNGVTYGVNPPAVGFLLLKSPISNQNELGLTSSAYIAGLTTGNAPCEKDPDNPEEAYKFVQGLKHDGTSWLNPEFNPPVITKYTYPGDPESGTGWTEYTGKINNCGGATTGSIVPSPGSDRRLIMNSGSKQMSLQSGDTTEVVIAKLIARGNSNLNSVTKLKELAALIKELYQGGFQNVGISQISTTIPDNYSLSQNYPNPFNPSTKIGFQIPVNGLVKMKVFDISGREVAVLVNENLNAGVYAVDFDGSKFASGLYFYTLETGSHRETKKMILLK